MEEFDEIWDFVEHKLGKVPNYFKNILKVCGFNNGITISSIVEEDIVYFEGEVKNGNVAKSFKDNVNALEGSMRPQENFEFIRGHKKFLLTIAATLKEHIRENGQDSCIVSKKNIKSTGKATKNKPVKRLCLPTKKKNISNVNSFVESAIAIQELSEGVPVDEDIKEHKRIILNKIVNSLIKHTEDMFNENIDFIKKQMSSNFASNLLQIEEKQSANDIENDSDADSDEENKNETEGKCVQRTIDTDTVSKYTAFVKCPFGCIKSITLFHIPTILNFFLWNTSNFDRHLKNSHKSESISRKDSIIDVTTKKAELQSKAIVNTDNLSIVVTTAKAESQSNAIVNTDNLSIVSHPCTSDIEEKLEKVKPRNQQSFLNESVVQDVQEKKLEKIQPISFSESGEQGNEKKKLKKCKKNKQSLLSESVNQDVEEKTLEKLEMVKPQTQSYIQPSLLTESREQGSAKKKLKKHKKNQQSLLNDFIVETDVEEKPFEEVEKLEKIKPRIKQILLSKSVKQDVRKKILEKVEKIQPSLLIESGEQGTSKKKLKKRKKNQQSLLSERVMEGVEERVEEKRQKTQANILSDGVKDEVKEWVKKKNLERRKKKQASLLSNVEPAVYKKKLEGGWRKYV